MNSIMQIIKNVSPNLIAQQITGVQPMTKSAGGLFNAKHIYYKSYNKKYWPHQYSLTRLSYNSSMAEIEKWCWDHFKSRHWQSCQGMFVFKRSEDAIMFKLRWHDYCAS